MCCDIVRNVFVFAYIVSPGNVLVFVQSDQIMSYMETEL